jgi:hypothetical protein
MAVAPPPRKVDEKVSVKVAADTLNKTDLPLALYEILEDELIEAGMVVVREDSFIETGQETDDQKLFDAYVSFRKKVETEYSPLDTWEKKTAVNDKVLPSLYAVILRLKEGRSALCLSGGGIRSATFNLGILQGLARHKLLDKFDYLSTVSGGGFVGGWLTAWIHRRGMEGVMAELSEPPHHIDRPVLKPDPDPIYNLRTYSNYLTPKKGLLSADTWTLVAIYLRNLLMNWLVFIPVIVAALFIPRIYVAAILAQPSPSWVAATLILGFITGTLGLCFAGLNLPSAGKRNYSLGWIWLTCLLPLVLSTILLTTFWVWFQQLKKQSPSAASDVISYLPFLNIASGTWRFIIFTVLSYLIAYFVYAAFRNHRRFLYPEGGDRKAPGGRSELYRLWYFLVLFVVAPLLVILAGAANGYLTWVAAHISYFNDAITYTRFYACFSVPFLLTLYNLGGLLIAGLTSRYTQDDDQEWWARAGAWIIIVIVSWVAINLLVLYGPSFLISVQADLSKLVTYLASGGTSKEKPDSIIYSIAQILIPVVSGAITLMGGFSAETPAHENQAKQPTLMSKVLGVVTSLSALIFLASIFVFLALVTNWVLVSPLGQSVSHLLTGHAPQGIPESLINPASHKIILYGSSGRFLLVTALAIGGLGGALGFLINTNRFSLHYYWRNRIMRAYLGASNFLRRPNKFTGFDIEDNVQMYKLKRSYGSEHTSRAPEMKFYTNRAKLLHVVNIALNLAGGDKVAWQDRKAESFTVSPLHCGSYWLGYRRSENYGGDNGISLGTAVAISGAAASPNMGYMMTSPVVRFLMTLFNVRLGWWLGNPGGAGSHTYKRDSPLHSITPIVQEAFGMTNDKSGYVYLSDGGHFENLGLYEMVLRRCRLILVSDASTDPEYSFESLAQAIRQIRVDFGVPIDFKKFYIAGPAQNKNGTYCAIGTIRYSCIDHGATEKVNGETETHNGMLIYLKPSLIGDEPRDILNYAGASSGFPQETIVDQWFSEAQFESYRALGSHIVDQICTEDGVTGDRNDFDNLKKFADNLDENLSRASWSDIGDELLAGLKRPASPGEEFVSPVRNVLNFLKRLKGPDGK